MSHKFGLGGMVNNSLGGSLGNTGNINIPKEGIICKVTDIILDENHPNYSEFLGFSQLGSIICKERGKDGSINPKIYNASPSNPNLKNFPIIGEDVKIFSTPSPNAGLPRYVYDSTSPIGQYGLLSPHSNQSPLPTTNTSTTTPQITYEDSSNLGAFNIDNIEEEEIDIINSPNPSQNTFIEKGNIHPLMYYNGDILHEGRWGQSIRFGSTTKSKSKTKNNYSLTGNNGDPIMIIRNGQDRLSSNFGAEPIVENIENDLSSIYLTSYQKVSNLSLETEKSTPFISYLNPPITPSQFNQPQVILNSDRIIIEAETDSVLVSAGKSVGLFSNESINIESKDINIHTDNRIRLGSKNAGESVLLGDKTYDVIEFTLNMLQILVDTLAPTQIYPTGAPIPDASTQAVTSTLSEAIKTVKEKVLVNIKSNKVKVE